MKISNMAIRNIRGNLYRYIMYYLSNVLTVAVFLIFGNFIFHPALRGNPLAPNGIVHMGVVNGLIASQIIILIFSFLFVAFSTSIFLKSRGKEFGLLSLFGMTKGQIRKYVLIETTIIAILSIITGVIVGIAFSKLFFMAMEAFMEIELPFYVSLKALALTVGVFFLLFEVINLLGILDIRNKEIIKQLKTNKIPKVIPNFSKKKALLGVVLLTIGYLVAWVVKGVMVPLAMMPVIIIVTIGTYFFFTQFSIFLTNRITKNKEHFYNRTNMISYSQMIFKLRDTAVVLFLAAILGAVTFTATESIYSFFTEAPRIAGLDAPHHIALLQKGEMVKDEESVGRIEEILEKENLEVKDFHKVKGMLFQKVLTKEEGTGHRNILAISNTDYNKMVKSIGEDPITVEDGEIVYSFIPPSIEADLLANKFFPEGKASVVVNNEEKTFDVKAEIPSNLTALNKMGYYGLYVLNDEELAQYIESADEDNLVIYNGVILENWRKSNRAAEEMQENLHLQYGRNFYNKIIPYKATKRGYGMTLFIGFFTAFLFFMAAGSIIYFKLFNEIKQDGIEFNILRKIGITNKELNKIITKQIAVIFFLPFVMSTIHSFFALKSLSNLLLANLFQNGLVVMVGYLFFQFLYFIAIRKIYINRIYNLTKIIN